ncbi:11234_t:CDS:2, partial [Gigaspora rosea]
PNVDDEEVHESLIDSSKDIEEAIKNLAGTHVAQLEPNRSQCNNDAALGTIAGIRNWHEWSWPNNGTEIGYIYTRSLLRIGPWKKFMPANIQKIVKKHIIKKPKPTITTHSHPSKSWTMPMPEIQGCKDL